MSNIEQTLSIIKPDAVERNLDSEIKEIFKKKNFKSKSKITFIKDRPGHDRRYALDSNKIIKQLKWTKKTNISDGLYKTVMWYIENESYFRSLKKKDIINRFGAE